MANVVFFVASRNFLPLALANAGVFARQHSRNFDGLIFYEDSDPIRFQIPAGVEIVTGALMPMVRDAAAGNASFEKVVWARLFAPYFLRGRYSRGLYCDADVSFFGPIDGLFGLDLCGAPIAAVTDCGIYQAAYGVTRTHLAAAGVRNGRYANADVLLIDVPAWCNHDLGVGLVPYCTRYDPAMLDQDFINYTFQDSWLELSPRWNFMSNLLSFRVERAIRPAIYHYSGLNRPWNEDAFAFEPIHRRYLEDALAEIGAPSFLNGFGRRLALGPKLKFAVKNLFYNTSLLSQRKRRPYLRWAKQYEAFYLDLERALADGRFADVTQGLSTIDLSAACQEPPPMEESVYCRGHIMPRLPPAK
jgi:lipopolysaccharide biosynthesis glycosyltransferase